MWLKSVQQNGREGDTPSRPAKGTPILYGYLSDTTPKGEISLITLRPVNHLPLSVHIGVCR